MSSLPQLSLALTAPLTASFPLPLTITITNPTPNPLTLLRWNTPLDPLAPRLGLFHATQILPDNDPEFGKEVSGLQLMISRVLPPSRDALVEILPGGVVEMEHVLKRHELDLKDGRTYRLWIEGWWGRVWEKRKEEVSDEMLEDIALKAGEFRSQGVEVRVRDGKTKGTAEL